MATKYVREDGLDRRGEPPNRGFFARMPPKRRLLVIYLGILVFAAFGMVASRFGAMTEFSGQAPQRCVATVISKELREGLEEPVPTLTLRLSRESGGDVDAEVPVEAEQWEAFSPGDRIGVLYRLSRWSGELRIIEVGMEPVE